MPCEDGHPAVHGLTSTYQDTANRGEIIYGVQPHFNPDSNILYCFSMPATATMGNSVEQMLQPGLKKFSNYEDNG